MDQTRSAPERGATPAPYALPAVSYQLMEVVDARNQGLAIEMPVVAPNCIGIHGECCRKVGDVVRVGGRKGVERPFPVSRQRAVWHPFDEKEEMLDCRGHLRGRLARPVCNHPGVAMHFLVQPARSVENHRGIVELLTGRAVPQQGADHRVRIYDDPPRRRR